MDIAALCQRAVVAVDERSSIRHAATLMRDRHVGALVVTREEGGSKTLAGSDAPAMAAKRRHVAVTQVLSSAWRRVVAPRSTRP